MKKPISTSTPGKVSGDKPSLTEWVLDDERVVPVDSEEAQAILSDESVKVIVYQYTIENSRTSVKFRTIGDTRRLEKERVCHRKRVFEIFPTITRGIAAGEFAEGSVRLGRLLGVRYIHHQDNIADGDKADDGAKPHQNETGTISDGSELASPDEWIAKAPADRDQMLRELRDLVEKMTKAAEAIKLRFDTLVAALGPSAGLKD